MSINGLIRFRNLNIQNVRTPPLLRFGWKYCDYGRQFTGGHDCADFDFDIIEEADDYNFAPVIGTYLRISRFLLTLVTMLLTPTWLLLIDNPQWLPEWMMFITVSDEITVPVFFQLLLLELSIDGLKLAAVNTPTLLSTPLSVVAGIVVGEYAVSSGWFNAESMLYMAVVSVGTYSQASFEMGYAMKFMRIILLCLTAAFNLAGYIAGIL